VIVHSPSFRLSRRISIERRRRSTRSDMDAPIYPLRTGSQYRDGACVQAVAAVEDDQLCHRSCLHLTRTLTIRRCIGTTIRTYATSRICLIPWRSGPAILVAVISVTKHMPEHPSDDPVLFLYAGCVASEIIDWLRFSSSHSINPQDFPVDSSFADLKAAVRRLHSRIVSESGC